MMKLFSVLIVTLVILSLSAKPTFSISIPFPNHNFPSDAGTSLFGDAHFIDGGHSVQVCRKTPSSFGIILRSTPFNFSYSTSFSSNFTFEIGNGVELIIIPADFPSKFARNASFALVDVTPSLSIEFDVNVCKISFSRVINVSKVNHVLKDGVKFTSWIDYHAITKWLEVRLSKLGDPRPVEPLISYRIDLGKMFKGEEILIGLTSSNENHEQITTVYSWSSEINDISKWLHSIPLIPRDYAQTSKKKGCFVSGFIYATGCGALASLILFFAWSYVARKWNMWNHEAEASVHPVDFKYEKIGVLELKNSETAMK